MKLTTLFLFTIIVFFQANFSFGQQTKLTLNLENVSVAQLLDEIENNTDFRFVYKVKNVDLKRKISVKFKSESINNVLDNVFAKTKTDFVIADSANQIFLTSRKEKNAAPQIPVIKTLQGTVFDQKGIPLLGASVLEKDTTNGTTTDFDGHFELSIANDNAVLLISHLGLITEQINVSGSSNIRVSLLEDSAELDEIIVTSYGIVKKSDLTGSVSSIKSEEAFAAPVSSLDNAIQGRASGVQVTTINGAPGQNATIRIRGGNSITAGNEPLYVIDGFVGAGNLSTINPNDIASVQILKDASSTAIYGARGTNGVILITTKKGKAGKITINFDTSSGFQFLPRKVDVQSASEFARYANAIDTDPSDGLPFDLNNLPGTDTDWQEALLQAAPVFNHQLSISGGSEKLQYYISAGYLSQTGIVKGSGFERFSLRTNIENKLSNIFKSGVNISLSRAKTNFTGTDFQQTLRADPFRPVFDEDGNFSQENVVLDLVMENQVANAELNTNELVENRILLNTYLEASFLDKFTLKSSFGGDFLFSNQEQFIPASNPASIVSRLLAQADIAQISSVDLLNENTLNFTENFGDHSINILAGITVQKQTQEGTNIEANGIPNDEVGVDAVELAPIEQTAISSDFSEFALFSLLGRLNYSYKNKYLLTSSIRRDGSSRLGANNRFAVFPSLALAWKISEESFLVDSNVVDALKLRASYGLTGNQNVDPFSTLSSFSSGTSAILGGIPAVGLQQGTLDNPNLKWETTKQFDLGLDFKLFNGRIYGELDFYYKKTEDLLLAAEVPFLTGFETIIQNVGALENRGIDVSLGGTIVQTNNFNWDATLTVSTFENTVLDLGNKSFISTFQLGGGSDDDTGRLIVGQPVGTFWGAIYDGVNPDTGNEIFRDISGPDGVPDGQYDRQYDQTVIGNANPDFFGGFQHNFRYKNFDLQAFFQFSYGNDIYNIDLNNVNNTAVNSIASLRENIWTEENRENAAIPGVGGLFGESNSFFVQDASHFRLKTLQLGYTLPGGLINGVKEFRMYITGTNLFLIKSDEYLGYDPDVSNFGTDNVLRGYDNFSYPQNRSIIAGVNITF